MAEAPSVRPLLNVEDLAQVLGMTVRAARQVVERGELPAFKVGRAWRIRPEALEEAFAAKEAAHRRDQDAAARILRGVPRPRKAS